MRLKALKEYIGLRPSFGVMVNRAAGLLAFSLVAVVLVEVFTPSASQATLPVIDTAAVAQLVQQTAVYAQQLATMANQVLLLKQQVQSLTGHYGMGLLVGSVNGWSNTTWSDILGMVNSGVNPGDAAQVAAYKAAHSHFAGVYPALDSSLTPVIPRMQATYQANYQTALAGLSAGHSTFDSVNSHLTELQALKNQIERTPTVKAAIDLNTTVAVKNAQISAELLRANAEAVYLQANGQTSQTNSQAAQAEFFAN